MAGACTSAHVEGVTLPGCPVSAGQTLQLLCMCSVQSSLSLDLLQAYKMQQKNRATLVDVREAKYFNKEHAAGCVNVGLFQSVQGRTPLDNLKRLAMAGFAMEATGMDEGDRIYLFMNFHSEAVPAWQLPGSIV